MSERIPTMLRFILALAVLLTAVVAPAAQAKTFYDVEVVIFENLAKGSGEHERWKPEVIVPRFDRATAFERGRIRGEQLAPLPPGFQALPDSQAQLGSEVERLRKDDGYRVLRHMIWRQPALDQPAAVPVRVHWGQPMDLKVPFDAYTATTAAEANVNPDWNSTAADKKDADKEQAATAGQQQQGTTGDGDAANGQTSSYDAYYGSSYGAFSGGGMLEPRTRDVRVYPLDGSIELVVSRYLHVYTDLYFTRPVDWLQDNGQAADSGNAGGAPAATRENVAGGATAPRVAHDQDGNTVLTYPFVQQRRMRSGELHYLDHPVLGMLIKVTPRKSDDGAD